ncbi:MAG: DUF6056 family protein [Bacteroidales bacterium]|nr:DUF6056 family protein [Bacteroidales bacterium]
MNKSRYISLAIITLTAILMWGLYQVTPYFCDDLWLGMDWLDGRASLEKYPDFVRWLTTEDSPRLFNFLFPVFLGYLPKWLFNTASGAIWLWSLNLMLRISEIKLNRPLWTLVLVLGLMICQPWRIDAIMCVIYSTNYVWTMPLLLLSIWWFTHPDGHGTLPLFLLGFFSGWAQECIALPLLGGCLLWWIVNLRKMNSPRWFYLGGLVTGIILTSILSANARYEDFDYALGGILNPKAIVIGGVTLNYLAIGALVLWCAMIMSKKLHPRLRATCTTMLIGATAVALIIGSTMWLVSERMTWFAQLLGLLTLIYLCNLIWPKPLLRNNLASISAGLILGALLFWHLGASIAFTHKQAKMWEKVGQEYIATNNGNVFCDIPLPQSIPWIVYNKGILSREAINGFHWKWRCKYYGGEEKPLPVPLELRQLNPDRLIKAAGENPFYIYGNLLVVPNGTEDLPIEVTITYNFGLHHLANISYTLFNTDTGDEYWYVTQDNPEALFPWKKIKQIDRAQ